MPIRYFKFIPLATIYHPVAQDILRKLNWAVGIIKTEYMALLLINEFVQIVCVLLSFVWVSLLFIFLPHFVNTTIFCVCLQLNQSISAWAGRWRLYIIINVINSLRLVRKYSCESQLEIREILYEVLSPLLMCLSHHTKIDLRCSSNFSFHDVNFVNLN